MSCREEEWMRTKASFLIASAAAGVLGLALQAVSLEGPYRVEALSGSRLEEFRELANSVDVNAVGAERAAQRDVGDYPDRGRQFLGELRYFAAQSRNLRSRAGAGEVHPRLIGPFVDRLLEDARQSDRSLRDARVFTKVWVDSGSTITMLHRMAYLVRFQ
jgi:hypothetical protein